MRSTRTALGWGTAALLVLGAVTAPATAFAAGNLVTNGGFESGTSGWSCTAGSAVASPVHTGSGALAGAASATDNAQCTQTIAVQPGTQYTLSASVQGSHVYLGESTTGASSWTSSATYTALSTTFTTGASQTSATIYLHGWYGQGTYYADDVSLTGPAGTVTVPGSPSGLAVSGTTASTASLSWTAASGTVSGYNVYRGGTKVGTTTGTSYTDSGLAASTSYAYTVTAYSSAGESAASSAVTATTATTTTGGGGGTGPAAQLPKHILTGYWQNFVNGAQALRLSAVPATYDLVAVAVAFADADPSTAGAVTFGVDPGLSSALGGYTAADFTADIATLHARGQKAIISVGGQNGTITVANATAATNFANSVNALISTYGFDGVDIDLENGVNPTYMGQALHAIAAAHPGAIITLAPQTIDMLSTGSAYFALALAVKDVLTVVNTQFYNSGSMNGCDGGVYAQGSVNFATALACTQLQGGLAPSQVGLGFPASPSGAGSGYVAPSVVNSSLTCLASGTGCGSFVPSAKYPAIRGAMTWSINWDASNGYAFANAVSAQLRAMP